MSEGEPDRAPADDWRAGWDAHRRQQLTMGLAATPAQRLQWLEEMIAFAYRAGALRPFDQQ
jgi:hypothetical protein